MGHVAAREIAAAALVVQHVGTGAGQDVNALTGQSVVRAFRKEGRAVQQLGVCGRIGGAEAGFGLDRVGAVGAKDGRILLRPGGDLDVCLVRERLHLVPLGKVLVGAPVIFIVDRTRGVGILRAGGQHGRVKRSKVCTRDQQSHHQHIAHRLAALKLHHRSGDDVLIPLFAPAPAMHNRVQQNHIQPGERGQVKDRVHRAGRVPVQHRDEERRHQITQQRPGECENDANRPIPPFDRVNRLRLMRCLHDVDDVGVPDKARGEEKQHANHIGCKRKREQIGLRVKNEGHLL